MAVVAVQRPECGSEEVVRYGRQPNGERRYRCDNGDCVQRIFLLQYHSEGWVPEVKRQIVDMTLTGSGIRDTARVLGVSPTTVLTTSVQMHEIAIGLFINRFEFGVQI